MAQPDNKPVLPEELLQHLQAVLLDLQTHPYPTIPSPEKVPKRASVALILRIQPHYNHWPPQSTPQAQEKSSEQPPKDLNSFFSQSWVTHGSPEVLFIKRAARKGDKWTSHIAFPGGRRDPTDDSDYAAAVRETWEEVGLDLSVDSVTAAGNLPQQVVSSGWGSVPYDDARSWGRMYSAWLADAGDRLMVLCPYVFVVTGHQMPPLRLQPTEVASAHWVPLRALLSPRQRTYWYQDVSTRTAQSDFGLTKMFHKLNLGDMMFAAVRLVPSESVYCSSSPEFLPEEPLVSEPYSLNHTAPLLGSGPKAPSPVDSPLLLWGLTLGIIGDFLDMLPPYNALRAWTYPTFTTLDVRLILYIMSHTFRKRRDEELEKQFREQPVAEEGRSVARLRLDRRRIHADTAGLLLKDYYGIVRKAVLVTFLARGLAASLAIYFGRRRIAALLRSLLGR